VVAGEVSAGRRRRSRQKASPDGAMTLMEHFKEFQVRLFRAVLGVLAGSAIAWAFYDQILHFITAPFEVVVDEARAQGKTVVLAVSGVTDAFTLQLQIVVVSGLVLSSPIWLYQLWRFLAPGLKHNERRWAYGFVLAATPLFLMGAAIAYRTMPSLLTFMLGFTPENVANIINVNEYLGFVIQLMLFFGVGMLIPVVFVMLNFAGLLSGRALLRWWRWLIIGCLTFAAIATPSPDPFTMLMVALPFLVIVAVAVAVMLVNDARRARRGIDDLSALPDDEASPMPEHIEEPDDLRPSRIDDDIT
jgi:sec-independent protein translocase protein TatC